MALVHVTNVSVLNNPARFPEPFQFEITFECLQELEDDVEWKIVYVGSADNTEFDQTLDTVLVGPVPVGCNKFVFEANAPDPSRIPRNELVGVTVVILTCSYREHEFFRVGYYVNTEFTDQELNCAPLPDGCRRDNPPSVIDVGLLVRDIRAANPIVTRYQIQWDGQQASEQGGDGAFQGQEFFTGDGAVPFSGGFAAEHAQQHMADAADGGGEPMQM